MTTVEIPRDRYGKPLIIPPGGGKAVAYARASSFGDVLDDRTNLEKYLRRMAIKGLTLKPELHLAASTTPLEEKWKLNQIAEQAVEAAGGGRKASIGSSIHTLTEIIDRGETVPQIPAEYAADLPAYLAATRDLDHVAIEQFMVCDELGVAGTPDRISRQRLPLAFAGVTLDPDVRIGDLKTGGYADYLGQHAVQLAIYAHSQFYDPVSGERTPVVVNQDWGIIYHLPAGSGECNLYAVDLRGGWDGALLAADVRWYRKRKGLAVPATAALAA